MITHLKGILEEISPAHIVVDCGGVGYFAHISVNTYAKLKDSKNVLLYTQHVHREDAELLFGFADKSEREVFRLLTTVSGIGPSSARMILSAMSPEEVQRAIASGDVRAFKAIKGIGEKSAQRIWSSERGSLSSPSCATCWSRYGRGGARSGRRWRGEGERECTALGPGFWPEIRARPPWGRRRVAPRTVDGRLSAAASRSSRPDHRDRSGLPHTCAHRTSPGCAC